MNWKLNLSPVEVVITEMENFSSDLLYEAGNTHPVDHGKVGLVADIQML